ncbi:MAG: hypothetical protein IPM63_02640 [Acidobacteriota bacterium]|nr:MAG: hypothetical protein IPM63_02640 [Acidobacteriota bacterium]
MFTGTFDPSGFDVKVECSTKALCFPGKFISTGPDKPAPDVLPRQLRAAPEINVPYRYNIRPLRKNLLLVTAFTPSYTVGDKAFTAAQPEAITRSFYLTRNDTCEKSNEFVKKEIVEREFGDRLVYVFGQPKPLPIGSVIYRGDLRRPEVFRFEKPGCFFFVDLVPSAMYMHPVLFVVVDEEDQKIIAREWESSPPLVSLPENENGEANEWFGTIEERLESPDLVHPTRAVPTSKPIVRPNFNLILPSGPGPIEASLFRLPRARYASSVDFRNAEYRAAGRKDRRECTDSKKVALVINAGRDLAYEYSVNKMKVLLASLKFDTVEELNWTLNPIEELRTKIREAAASVSECDTFVVYLTAHTLGVVDGRVRGPDYYTDGEINYKHPATILGRKTEYHPFSISNLKSNKTWVADKYDSGPGLLYMLRNAKAGFVQVILDMCMSGLLIDAAKGTSPEWSGPPIADYLSANQNLMLITATRRDQESNFNTDSEISFLWGDLGRGDAKDPGGLFTQIFVKEFRDEIKGARVDSDKDGRISTEEYRSASKLVFEETEDQFGGLVDGWLRGRSQDPQMYETAGNKPR